MTDFHEFLESCKDGSPVGWRTLFDDYSPLLYNTLRACGTDHELAEDLVGDVFIRLMEDDRRRFREAVIHDETKLRSWLVTIAKNLYLDKCRHEKHVRSLAAAAGNTWDSPAVSMYTSNSGSDNLLAEIGQRDLVEKALHELSVREQLIVKLTYFEEFKLREIADMLNEPMGTVASLLSRSREKLRVRMQEIQTFDRSMDGGAP